MLGVFVDVTRMVLLLLLPRHSAVLDLWLESVMVFVGLVFVTSLVRLMFSIWVSCSRVVMFVLVLFVSTLMIICWLTLFCFVSWFSV